MEYIVAMQINHKTRFKYSEEKNEIIKSLRNISFEDIISAISENKIAEIVKHPDKERYPDQYCILVNINEYIYVVPFVLEGNNTVFLTTIYPSRKLTKQYLGGHHEKK